MSQKAAEITTVVDLFNPLVDRSEALRTRGLWAERARLAGLLGFLAGVGIESFSPAWSRPVMGLGVAFGVVGFLAASHFASKRSVLQTELRHLGGKHDRLTGELRALRSMIATTGSVAPIFEKALEQDRDTLTIMRMAHPEANVETIEIAPEEVTIGDFTVACSE